MRRLSITLYLALFGAVFLAAQTKPNFSGTWKINPERSDFGPFPKPAEGWTVQMVQRGVEIWTMPADAPEKNTSSIRTDASLKLRPMNLAT